MKKLLPLLILFSFFYSGAVGQVVGGRSSKTIHDLGAEILVGLEEQDKEIVRMEYDIIFDEKESFRTLSEEWEYSIMAFADEGVKVLNISLWYYSDLDDTWNKVTETNSETNYAFIHYKPSSSRSFRVVVKVDQFEEGFNIGRYGIFYLHD